MEPNNTLSSGHLYYPSDLEVRTHHGHLEFHGHGGKDGEVLREADHLSLPVPTGSGGARHRRRHPLLGPVLVGRVPEDAATTTRPTSWEFHLDLLSPRKAIHPHHAARCGIHEQDPDSGAGRSDATLRGGTAPPRRHRRRRVVPFRYDVIEGCEEEDGVSLRHRRSGAREEDFSRRRGRGRGRVVIVTPAEAQPYAYGSCGRGVDVQPA